MTSMKSMFPLVNQNALREGKEWTVIIILLIIMCAPLPLLYFLVSHPNYLNDFIMKWKEMMMMMIMMTMALIFATFTQRSDSRSSSTSHTTLPSPDIVVFCIIILLLLCEYKNIKWRKLSMFLHNIFLLVLLFFMNE